LSVTLNCEKLTRAAVVVGWDFGGRGGVDAGAMVVVTAAEDATATRLVATAPPAAVVAIAVAVGTVVDPLASAPPVLDPIVVEPEDDPSPPPHADNTNRPAKHAATIRFIDQE